MRPLDLPGRVVGYALSVVVDTAFAVVVTPIRWWDDLTLRLSEDDPLGFDADLDVPEVEELRAEWRQPRPALALDGGRWLVACGCATPVHEPDCPRADR